MRPESITFTMPPGDYILGDPLYSMSDEVRQEYMENRAYQAPFTLKGLDCLLLSTAYGDGIYPDQEGFEYSVDSGQIGVLPVSVTELDDHHRPMVKQVSFSEPFECRADYHNRSLQFGHINIDVG